VKAVLRTSVTTGKSYAEAAKTFKTVDAMANNITQHAEKKTTTAGADYTAVKDDIMQKVTGAIEKAIGQLKETLERTISETFDQMKSCLVEMKKALEADMDQRDETIQSTCATREDVYYELYQQAKKTDTITYCFMGLYQELFGESDPSDEQTKLWNRLNREVTHQKEVMAALKSNIPDTQPTSVSTEDVF